MIAFMIGDIICQQVSFPPKQTDINVILYIKKKKKKEMKETRTINNSMDAVI